MLVSALSLIANVYIVSISARCPAIPMSVGTHAVIFKCLARLVCYRTPLSRNGGSSKGRVPRHRCGDPGVAPRTNKPAPGCLAMQYKRTNYGDLCYHGIASMGEWQAAGDVLDRLFVCVFTVMFLVIGIFELTA